MSTWEEHLAAVEDQIDDLTTCKALMHTNLEIMDVTIGTETFRQMVTKVLDVVGNPVGGPDI